MSGRHSIPQYRPERRRGTAFALAGVVAGVVVCGTAVALVLNRGTSAGPETGLTSRGMSVKTSPVPVRTERQIVPDACELVSESVARELVPKADRTQTDTFAATDSHNQCVWSSFGAEQRRQLTVELRAVPAAGGRSAADEASSTLDSERKVDEDGEGLPAGQKLSTTRTVEDVGDGGYLTYSVNGAQRFGEAIVNIRVVNVLVTVHYAGGSGADAPLSSGAAIDGAIKAVKETVTVLGDR